MLKQFNNKSGYPKPTFDCIFIKDNNYRYKRDVVNMNGYQLFVKIDISEFQYYDTINEAYFLLPIKELNFNLTFKVFKTDLYENMRDLRFNDLSSDDKNNLKICDDSILFVHNSGKNYVKFDITKIFRKRVHERK